MRTLKKITEKKQGYTLLELTVVMVILLIVGTLIVGILASSFRGNAKSKITNDLGQNGNYALTVLTDIILNAQKFQSITDAGNTVYSVCTPTGIDGKKISVVGFDGGVTNLTCDDTTSYTISSNSASLLDTSRVKLYPNSCKFTCIQADEYSAPRIDISFRLQNAQSNVSSDSQGSALFNTSLSLRKPINSLSSNLLDRVV